MPGTELDPLPKLACSSPFTNMSDQPSDDRGALLMTGTNGFIGSGKYIELTQAITVIGYALSAGLCGTET
jgi:hypothetical protein